MTHFRICGYLIVFLGLGATAQAQDPFEIHVYEYETLNAGQFSLEQHLNYWAKGSKLGDGTVTSTNDQFHMTYEITGGITKQVSLGLMQLNGIRPGDAGLEYAGWRVLPHVYVPKSWHLPVDLGLVVEFSLVRPVYVADSRRVEIRPVVERRIGPVQIDVNPVFARVLHGPGTKDGWNFEPAARAAYGDTDTKRIVPYLEWYSEVGSLRDIAPAPDQFHQLLPGVDLRISERLLWSVGVGIGVTSIEPRIVYKSRLEFNFGRR